MQCYYVCGVLCLFPASVDIENCTKKNVSPIALTSKSAKMDFSILSILLGAIVLLALYLVNRYRYWNKRGIPCPKGMVPLLGHMLPMLTFQSNMSDICRKMYEDFPDASMIGFYKLTNPVLLVRDPALVKSVLQVNFTSFHANVSKVDPKLDPLAARHPFFTYGDDWMTGRKRLSYAFSGARLKILFESVNGVCKKLVNFLEKQLKTSDPYEVELKYLFSKFTGEVVANAGLGIEGQCFDEDATGSPFQTVSKSIFQPSGWASFVQFIIFFAPELNCVFRTPVIPKEVDEFFRMLVREVLKSRKHETAKRNDFFQLMIDLGKTEAEKIDEEILAAHALSFFIDGYETSSITLSFAAYHIAAHKDVQQKLREEVLSALSKHNGVLTYDALKEMTYMDLVINESQRHFPAAGVLVKKCTKEYELEGSDGLCVRVKPGTDVFIPVHGLHMDSKYWPDPENFDPDRFSDDRKQNNEKFAYMPFGEGPRMCVGMRMALMQIKACLATVLKDYQLELSPKTQLPLKLSPSYFLSAPVGGLWVYIKRL